MVSGVWNLPAWMVDDRAPRAISVWVWQPYGSRGPCLRESSVDEGWMLINQGNALKRSGWKKMAAVPPRHRYESTVWSMLSFILFCGRKYQQQCYYIRLLFSYAGKFSQQIDSGGEKKKNPYLLTNILKKENLTKKGHVGDWNHNKNRCGLSYWHVKLLQCSCM